MAYDHISNKKCIRCGRMERSEIMIGKFCSKSCIRIFISASTNQTFIVNARKLLNRK